MPRTDHEAAAIILFEALARKHYPSVFKGQGVENRLPVSGNAYFQFGDLRVDRPKVHVVIEVESAGGVTNLVKYWSCIESRLIDRPVRLIHLFQQESPDDYRSHIELWRFLSAKMKAALGNQFDGAPFTYTKPVESELRPALEHFARLLDNGAV